MALAGWNPNNILRLTIDSSKIDDALTNFPVLVTLSSGTGITGFDAAAVFDELTTVTGTHKIAITDSSDNQLYVEIENWDWVNELANLWVKVPTIVSTTDTNLYLYYDSTHEDNVTYIGDTGDAAAQSVWDSNFVGVWHMAQDPSIGGACILDSTSYMNHGTPAGTMLTEDLVDGKAGKALDFDGGDDNINIGTPTNLNFGTGYFTLDFVIKPDSIGSNQRIIDKQSNTAPYVGIYYAQINAAGTVKFFVRDVSYSTGVVESISTLVSGTYYQVSCVYDSTGSKVYIDNALNNSNLTTVGDIDNRNQDFVIGEYFYDGIWQFGGIIDEVRVSNTDRPAEWLKATYYSNWNILITFSEATVFGKTIINGEWKNISSVQLTIDGEWKDVSEIQIIKNGTWKPLIS